MPLLKINPKFLPKDIVYLVTDSDQRKWLVNNIIYNGTDELMYTISSNGESIEVYDYEISKDKDYTLS